MHLQDGLSSLLKDYMRSLNLTVGKRKRTSKDGARDLAGASPSGAADAAAAAIAAAAPAAMVTIAPPVRAVPLRAAPAVRPAKRGRPPRSKQVSACPSKS